MQKIRFKNIPEIKYSDFPNLLNDSFMQKYTKFSSFEEMEDAYESMMGKKMPRKVFMSTDDSEREMFVSINTEYATWTEMIIGALNFTSD